MSQSKTIRQSAKRRERIANEQREKNEECKEGEQQTVTDTSKKVEEIRKVTPAVSVSGNGEDAAIKTAVVPEVATNAVAVQPDTVPTLAVTGAETYLSPIVGLLIIGSAVITKARA